MINITDVSAVDKLIDFYGENCMVSFEDASFDLADFRDYCVDNKIMLDIDNFVINSNGIFSNSECIVKIIQNNSYNRDDLSSI